MKLIILSLLSLSFLISCQESTELTYDKIERKKEHYNKIINQKNKPNSPDLGEDIFLANYDYPVEVALYRDGKFYYNLDNLRDGHGTWKFVSENMIETYSEGLLFDFVIKIYTTNNEGSKFQSSFTDRFGYNQIELKVINKK